MVGTLKVTCIIFLTSFCCAAQAQVFEGLRGVPMTTQPMASIWLYQLEEKVRVINSDYQSVGDRLDELGVKRDISLILLDRFRNPVAAMFYILSPKALIAIPEILLIVDPFVSQMPEKLRYQLLKKIVRADGVHNFKQLKLSVASHDFFTLAYLMELMKLRGFDSVEMVPRSSNSYFKQSIVATDYNPRHQQEGAPSLEETQTVAEELVEKALAKEVANTETARNKVNIEVAYALEPEVLEVDPNFCAKIFGN